MSVSLMYDFLPTLCKQLPVETIRLGDFSKTAYKAKVHKAFKRFPVFQLVMGADDHLP